MAIKKVGDSNRLKSIQHIFIPVEMCFAVKQITRLIKPIEMIKEE